jgi:pimeloyl-ACP methyl ester carboxylesterase
LLAISRTAGSTSAWSRQFLAALLAGCLSLSGGFGLTGCVSSILANMAVKAPNQQDVPRALKDPQYAARFDALAAQSWRQPVGPPTAELAVAVLEPGFYDFRYEIRVMENAKGQRWLEPGFEWTLPARLRAQPPLGTILLLHGYADARENMMHWGLYLAGVGYRCVLVDLRGHGRSTGKVIGYGAFETRDLQRLLDELQKRGLMSEKVGVLGVSYGASVGLLLAARDDRVGPVVALEPYSAAENAIVEFAHGVAPDRAARISDGTFAAAVAKAPKRGSFSWSDADVLAAMARLSTPVLFFHGEKDRWLSPENSKRLAAVAPAGSRLMLLKDDDHLSLSMKLVPIVNDVREWFGRYLAAPVTTGIPPAP